MKLCFCKIKDWSLLNLIKEDSVGCICEFYFLCNRDGFEDFISAFQLIRSIFSEDLCSKRENLKCGGDVSHVSQGNDLEKVISAWNSVFIILKSLYECFYLSISELVQSNALRHF